MSEVSSKRLEALFHEVVRLPPESRERFLDEQCGRDTKLRDEELLHHDDAAPQAFLGGRAAETSTAVVEDGTADPMIGERIGQYRIRRLIATGGMGTVYEAQQEQPRRSVALKLMNIGVVSRAALRRFDFEAQLLGRLRHAGIAQVYDAGTHDRLPYFAMEYIPNALPITEFAGSGKLSNRQRLELFIKVCDAVQHGHQKGIIHRDLKPSNILVDSSGQPKVIDFGVARSTDSDMAVTTLQTAVGQLIGTLQYMSPEQCAADPRDLDTRSDVYSLGVVLYELISEHLPYDLSNVQMAEATRVIREQPPTQLSTIKRTLRGDLETIVLTALEKDRQRRYQSAADLAHDIRRYLSAEPIAARPPNVVYQLRTFARRNKTLVGGVAAVFVVLVAGVITTTWQWSKAQAAANEAQAINEFLAAVLGRHMTTDLSNVSNGFYPRDMKVSELLDVAAGQVEIVFEGQPTSEATVRLLLSDAYWRVARYAESEAQARAALTLRQRLFGEKDRRTLQCYNALAEALRSQGGKFSEAQQVARRQLQLCRELFGDRHSTTANAMRTLAFTLRTVPRHFEECEQLLRDSIAIEKEMLGSGAFGTRMAQSMLAELLQRQNRLDEAEVLSRETIEVSRRLAGEDDYPLWNATAVLGHVLSMRGEYEHADAHFRSALEGLRRVCGPGHPYTSIALDGLGRSLNKQKRFAEAEPYLRECWQIAKAINPQGDWTYMTMKPLACSLQSQGKYTEAEAIYRARIELAREEYGSDHPRTLQSIKALAWFLCENGRPAEAEPLAREAVAGYRSRLKKPSRAMINTLDTLAVALRDLQRYEEGDQVFQEVVALWQQLHGESKPLAPELQLHHGECLLLMKRYTESEPLLLQSYKTFSESNKPEGARKAASQLVLLYDVINDTRAAASWRSRLSNYD